MNRTPNHPAAEIESLLKKLPRQNPVGIAEAYIGGGKSKLRYLGLSVPQVTGVLKSPISFMSADESSLVLAFDRVWNQSEVYEAMSVALSWFSDQRKRKKSLVRFWPVLKKWSSKIDNWAHSDSLSGIYAAMLEENPKLVYPTLLKWSDSKNPWLRRQSMVSLLYYRTLRKKILPHAKLFPLIEKQLDHPDMYVQKGVGWTLREIGHVYPKETLAFLERHLTRLSSYAFSAATEKLDARTKEPLKLRRKIARKRQ